VWLPHHPEPHGYDRLVFASPPLDVGEESWLYYGAWDGDHLVFNRDGSLFEPGFARTGRTARATFRRDGYVSLDAGPRGGRLVTKSLRFEGARLAVNLAAPEGRLRTELRTDDDKPVDGFSFADCAPVTGDGLSLPVQWRGGAGLRRRSHRGPLRAVFELTNASLYGFRFE
jgi:hypothetical protein